jgi:DNA-binding NarL/FixJ family response regulator
MEFVVQDDGMTRVYLADAQPEERSALSLLVQDLKMTVSGEAADWSMTMIGAPASGADLLVVDANLLPGDPGAGLDELRLACPRAVVILLVNRMDPGQQAMLSMRGGVDVFIRKDEGPEYAAKHLLRAAANLRAVR